MKKKRKESDVISLVQQLTQLLSGVRPQRMRWSLKKSIKFTNKQKTKKTHKSHSNPKSMNEQTFWIPWNDECDNKKTRKGKNPLKFDTNYELICDVMCEHKENETKN